MAPSLFEAQKRIRPFLASERQIYLGQGREEDEEQLVSKRMKLPELEDRLEQLKKEGKYVDVGICPRCKSTRIRRVGSMQGDMSGHMALTMPKYECLDCGWRGRLIIYATNKPLSEKQLAVAAQAFEQDKSEKKKRKTDALK